MIALLAFLPLALAGKAEIQTNNLRDGASFDNIKASWSQALNIGNFKTDLNCKYDYNANKDFLKEVSLKGDLVEAKSDDDVRVGYEVTRNFQNKNTDVKLTATSRGTSVFGEYADNQLQEVGASRQVDVSDYQVDVTPSWRVKAKTARVKLMSALGGGKDRVSAEVDYNADDGVPSVHEVGYERELEEGRHVAATLNPKERNLEVEYRDDKFESGASWTATANVPLENSNNILDQAKLTLTRAWNW